MTANSHPTARFYESSDRINIIGIVLVLIIGLPLTIALGLTYGYLMWNIPSIYLSVLVVGLYGGLIGVIVGFLGTLGKIRNKYVLLALGLFLGIVAEYVGWLGWMGAIFESLDAIPMFLSDFTAFTLFIRNLAVDGVWSIGDAPPISGALLYFLWALEALSVIGLASIVAYNWANNKIFCEDCNKWVTKQTAFSSLAPITDKNIVPSALDGNFEPLKTLERVNTDLFSRLTIHQCDNCNNANYLSLSRIHITKDSRGRQKTDETDYIRHLVIDYNTAEDIKTHFKQ
ncbi:MAG TPA: hypothetical protein VLL52_18560 [Anaerolineae bacterium]|nr:hypothetical protein [Anaerolineae bacterium]